MAKGRICCGFRAPKLHFLILLTLPLLSHAETVRQEAARAGILDGQILPKSYEIHIKPDYDTSFDKMTYFEGTVLIVFTLEAPKSELLLNAAESVEVNETKVIKVFGGIEDEDPNEIETTFVHQGQDEKIIIRSSTNFPGGRYNMTIKYKGLLTPTGSVGFYKSAYTTMAGQNEESRYLLTTQFEPTHARKAFPCFDEPRFKATFKVSVDVPRGYWALSNSIVDTSEPPVENGPTTIHFKETPLMSTYLVAFIIYEENSFKQTETNILESNVTLTAWGPREDVTEGLLDFSQNASQHSVEALEEFTSISYSRMSGTKKIDQVAVKSFASGAMENWGLITYRDTQMYYSEEKYSEAQKKSVAMILAHELAHQWFGNLITMTWWNNTWVKEGFAQFFQYYSLNSAYPEWRMMEQLLVDQQQSIFESDADESSKPLTHDVETFEEIRGQFGSITYRKGASFLRMIYYIMGEENFQSALRSYLMARAYANVEPSHLWSNLAQYLPGDVQLPELVENDNVTDIDERRKNSLTAALETWTLQPGFPVLQVMRNYETNTVTFSQERFLLSGKRDDKTKYWIAASWSVKGETRKRKLYLLADQDDVTVKDMGYIDEYILVHSQGYYRVNYDAGNWLSLALKLLMEGKNSIEAVDRAQLVDDAFTLARAGYTKYGSVVNFLRYLSRETDPLPWVAAFRAFTFLDRVLAPTDTQNIFYNFIQQNIRSLYKEIGLGDGATHMHRVHQANIILWACRSRHADCLDDVTKLADEYFKEERTIKSHLRRNVLCYAIREKTEDFWQKAYDRLSANERSDILSALTCTKDEARLERLLNLNLTDSELTTLFSNLNSNPEGQNVALDFFIENFEDIYKSQPETVGTILRSFGERITSKDNQQKLKRFFNRILEEDANFDENLVNEVEDAIKENLEWLEKYGDDALSAFYQDVPTPPTTSTKAPSDDDGGQASIAPLPALLVSALLAWRLHNV